VPLFEPDSEGCAVTYDATSTGIRRTTIYTTPDDRTRLKELMRQMTLAEPPPPRGWSASEAIRAAVDYMLSYAFGMGEEGPGAS
jgi:hypothetical protein